MIYLDSAILEEAEAAVAMGWVKGITTNPTLLNKSQLSPEQMFERASSYLPRRIILSAMRYEL